MFNDTATTEIYTRSSSAASDVYKRQAREGDAGTRPGGLVHLAEHQGALGAFAAALLVDTRFDELVIEAVSYTHLRAHETVLDLVCRLLLEKKKKQILY